MISPMWLEAIRALIVTNCGMAPNRRIMHNTAHVSCSDLGLFYAFASRGARRDCVRLSYWCASSVALSSCWLLPWCLNLLPVAGQECV